MKRPKQVTVYLRSIEKTFKIPVEIRLSSEDTAKIIFCYILIWIKILPCEGLEPPYFGAFTPNAIPFGHQGFKST